MRKLLVFMTAIGLLLGACGSGDDDNKADTLKGDTDSKQSAALEARLLTLSDLPSGYTKTAADDSEDEEESGDDEFCPELSQLEDDIEAVHEAEVEFEASSENGFGGVNEALSEFENAGQAEEALSKASAALEKCKSFTETDETDGTTTTGSLAPISFKKFGDETFAAKLTATVSGDDDGDASTPPLEISFDGAFVAVREGKHIALFFLIGVGDKALSTAEQEGLVEKAVAKI